MGQEAEIEGIAVAVAGGGDPASAVLLAIDVQYVPILIDPSQVRSISLALEGATAPR